MDLNKLHRNIKRSAQIISQMGGYENFLKFMHSSDNSSLKQEILKMNREMSDLGIMTQEVWDDPKRRKEFLETHYKVIIGIEKMYIEKNTVN